MKSPVLLLSFLILLITSCSTSKEHESTKEESTKDTLEVKMAEGVMEAEDPPVRATPATINDPKLDSMRLLFAEGSWEYKILDFIESERVEEVFVLDKVPYEGEELPADGVIQIEHLCDLLTAFPYLQIEVRAHSKAAGNAMGKATKKAGSKARAVWVAAKIDLKGIQSKRISSTGMGDSDPVHGLAPDDDGQKRITAVLTKSQMPGF